MNVSLTPELEGWVKEKVASGLYQSTSEVVREALRVLRTQERLQELQREELCQQLVLGLEQLDHGKSRPLNPALVEEIKQKGRLKGGTQS